MFGRLLRCFTIIRRRLHERCKPRMSQQHAVRGTVVGDLIQARLNKVVRIFRVAGFRQGWRVAVDNCLVEVREFESELCG